MSSRNSPIAGATLVPTARSRVTSFWTVTTPDTRDAMASAREPSPDAGTVPLRVTTPAETRTWMSCRGAISPKMPRMRAAMSASSDASALMAIAGALLSEGEFAPGGTALAGTLRDATAARATSHLLSFIRASILMRGMGAAAEAIGSRRYPDLYGFRGSSASRPRAEARAWSRSPWRHRFGDLSSEGMGRRPDAVDGSLSKVNFRARSASNVPMHRSMERLGAASACAASAGLHAEWDHDCIWREMPLNDMGSRIACRPGS